MNKDLVSVLFQLNIVITLESRLKDITYYQYTF